MVQTRVGVALDVVALGSRAILVRRNGALGQVGGGRGNLGSGVDECRNLGAVALSALSAFGAAAFLAAAFFGAGAAAATDVPGSVAWLNTM